MATSTTTEQETRAQQPSRAAGEEQPARPTIRPRVDIYETDAGFVLLADMPGVEPQSVEVETERRVLVIRGRATPSGTEADYREFELGEYARAFTLSDDLDTDRITAAMREGVLRVEIAKSAESQPKKIPVRADGQ